MSDFGVNTPRSAFREASKDWRNSSEESSVSVAERATTRVIEITAFAGQELALGASLRQACECELPQQRMSRKIGERTIIWSGPSRWILETPSTKDYSTLKAALHGIAAVVEQTDGRTLLRLSGKPAGKVLQKGLKIDLDPSVFKPGAVALTVIEETEAHVVCHGKDGSSFDVTINRSMTESFWRWLTVSSEDYGLWVAN